MSSLFSNLSNNFLPQDGEAIYEPTFYTAEQASFYHIQLLQTIKWKHEELIMFGKRITTKRKVALYGDPNIEYTYSNRKKIALPWTPELVAIKNDLEAHLNTQFNTCLLNLYHDGSEGMGWHSDDEKELEKDGIIASLSFGATRKFLFKHKSTKEKVDVNLQSGSLLIMKGKTQRNWLHQLPQSKKVHDPRINLTFRKIICS